MISDDNGDEDDY
jgi:hypothetical protein